MHFTPGNVDYDCSLSNPAIALALALSALLFGAWAGLALASSKPVGRRLVNAGFVFLGSFVGAVLMRALTLRVMAAEDYERFGPNVEVGCIGDVPPFLGPLATIVCAAATCAAAYAWRRTRRLTGV